ncbi:MAG: nicotinamidase-related amidase [Gammaproteobacteria bacterium]
MSALELPAGKTALLVMDVQNDIVHIDGKLGGELGAGAMPKLIAEKEILHNIAGLMTAARDAGVPVIHVRHVYRADYRDMPKNISIFRIIKNIGALSDGSWGAEIHESVKPAPGEFVVDKTRISAFYASTLAGLLEAQGLTHLIMTGIATDGVIDGTARDAADRGYYVIIPSDCCASTSEKSHNTILRGVLALIAKVCDSSETIDALSAHRKC